MKQTGIEVLSSGNLLKWEQETAVGRGAVRASFTSAPTQRDMEQAKAFMESKPPASAEIVARKITTNAEAAKNAMVNHLFGGSRN